MSPSDKDTIVAIATPPGEGAVGIVRLSGGAALSIAESHVDAAKPLSQFRNYQLHHVALILDDRARDGILLFIARAPGTYTGEDTVEFQCHGSPALLNRLVRSLQRAGARAAEPGEFTKRAFLNGKMDLTQAEAVADLVSARTDVGLDSAYFQLRGGLRDRFQTLASELRQTKTLLEAELDFGEDVSLDPDRVVAQLQTAVTVLDRQIDSYATGKLIREGARVTLCGRPNVGKSSLMNALLGQERAIVTETAGTTRDTIEESIDIDGIVVTLTDTAGLRETQDPIEREGTLRTVMAVEASDLALFVCDGSQRPTEEEKAFLGRHPDALKVLNKSDLGQDEGWASVAPEKERVLVSALTGQGLDDLRDRLGRRLTSGHREAGSEGVTNERHVVALRAARNALERGMSSVRDGAPGEIISFEIDESLIALAGIIGETTAQDILDAIFNQFCIGK